MELGFFFVRFLTECLKWISFPIRKIFRKKSKRIIPRIDDKILLCSGTNLAKMIRNKQVPCQKVIETYITRIKQTNPIINAIVENRFDKAISEAQEVDKFLAETNLTLEELASTKPLLGMPVTIKESCAVKGLSLVVGSTFMEGTKADEDGAAVAKLRNAGAIPLLVSTTSELCLSINCESLVNGTTRNPYDLSRTSGGSSGGEGALIGSGSSLMGIGSDLAGSVRIPAMFNSIFGHKPTAKLVPMQGHWPTSTDKLFYNYITIGPLTRYAEDLKLMMKVLCESNKINFDNKVDLQGCNLYFMEDIGFYVGASVVQHEIKNALRSAVNYLSESYKMNVKNDKFEELKNIGASCIVLLLDIDDKVQVLTDLKNPEVKYTATGQLLKYIFSKPQVKPSNAIGEVVGNRLNFLIPKSHLDEHRYRITALREKMLNCLENNGILIFPTFPTSAFGHREILWNMFNCAAYTLPCNILGLPSTQVPAGFDSAGMPIGLQIISAPHQDHICIAVAEVLEKHFGGWQPPFEL